METRIIIPAMIKVMTVDIKKIRSKPSLDSLSKKTNDKLNRLDANKAAFAAVTMTLDGVFILFVLSCHRQVLAKNYGLIYHYNFYASQLFSSLVQ